MEMYGGSIEVSVHGNYRNIKMNGRGMGLLYNFFEEEFRYFNGLSEQDFVTYSEKYARNLDVLDAKVFLAMLMTGAIHVKRGKVIKVEMPDNEVDAEKLFQDKDIPLSGFVPLDFPFYYDI